MASNWSDSELRQRVARARHLLNARDWQESEKEIEEGLALYPEAAVLLALAADLCRKMRKLAEAESYLKRAEAADPAHAGFEVRRVVEAPGPVLPATNSQERLTS